MSNQTTQQQLISEVIGDKAKTWLTSQGYNWQPEAVYPAYVKQELVTEAGETATLTRWAYVDDEGLFCLETFIDFESNAQEVYLFGNNEDKLLLALQQHQPAKPGTQSYGEEFQFLTPVS